MEKESNISLGRTIILLALFGQNLMFGQRYILSRSSDIVNHFNKALCFQKSEVFLHSQEIINQKVVGSTYFPLSA